MKRAPMEMHGPLAEPIRAFVSHKRALNRRFDTEERALRLLDRYLVQHGIVDPGSVTAAVIDAFLASRPRSRPRSFNHLLGVVRRLFDWMVVQEMIDQSPVRLRPRREAARRIPYLFDLPHARRLLEITSTLADANNALLRGPTYATIFAVLFGLGMRVGEVSRLTRADVDLDRRLFVVRETKFAKSRLVPFGPCMAARLVAYLALRERRIGVLEPLAPIFSFTPGRAIHPGTISQTFHALVPRLGLTLPAGIAAPRVHDLRHSFAVGTLLRWYRDGSDPGSRLLHLSTFLGHVDPASTAVYLTITADLLQAAGDRFARFAAPLATGAAP
jgi:site-specific recombinase XerD